MSNYHYIHPVYFLEPVFPVNCYLIEEKDSLTLIDAALPFSAKKILRISEQIGKPITNIVLTHAHDDHVGALDKLKQLIPNVTVHISSRDAKLLSGDRSLQADEPSMPIRGGVPKKVQTRADVLLEDGDRIGSLIAIATPGHTPGSMSFLDERTKAIVAGDAFQLKGGIAVAGQLNLSFPFPAMATWNKQLALESARKIAKLKPSLLAVGHGKMIKQPLPLIERAIKRAEKKLQEAAVSV